MVCITFPLLLDVIITIKRYEERYNRFFFLLHRTGFVQFIESTALADVIKTDGSILNFFQKHAPSENSPLGVAPEIMDNYIKSLGK